MPFSAQERFGPSIVKRVHNAELRVLNIDIVRNSGL